MKHTPSSSSSSRRPIRWIAASLLVALAALPTLSEARGYGGHWHGGGWGPRWGVSVGIGLPLFYPSAYAYDGYYGYPSTVVVAPPPPTVVYAQQPSYTAPAQAPAPASTSYSRPDPVVYPRNSQSAEQTESDTRACNSWAATSVPRAKTDASVFQRAIEACMDGRGYTVR
ncbi:MAG TPA: hypothetical protein VGM81_24150 [Burkholderiaceae bacterium]|jgi:hypothetical protein